MIERQRQLERLVSVMGNGTVKVITGIRRCGKSYLLNTIFRKYLQKQGVRKDHICDGIEFQDAVKGCGDEFSWQKDGDPVDAAVIFRVPSVSGRGQGG